MIFCMSFKCDSKLSNLHPILIMYWFFKLADAPVTSSPIEFNSLAIFEISYVVTTISCDIDEIPSISLNIFSFLLFTLPNAPTISCTFGVN